MNDLPRRQRWTCEQWNALTLYGRFEQLVAWTITVVVSAVIVVAIVRLTSDVLTVLIFDLDEPLHHRTFQTVFDRIMTVLIAMELTHSILHAPARLKSVVQVRTLLLIAMLALTRKLIIIDLETLSPAFVAAVALVLLILGVLLWLLRDLEGRAG